LGNPARVFHGFLTGDSSAHLRFGLKVKPIIGQRPHITMMPFLLDTDKMAVNLIIFFTQKSDLVGRDQRDIKLLCCGSHGLHDGKVILKAMVLKFYKQALMSVNFFQVRKPGCRSVNPVCRKKLAQISLASAGETDNIFAVSRQGICRTGRVSLMTGCMRQAQETADVAIALQRDGKKYKGRAVPDGGFSSDYRFDLALKGCPIESDSAIQAVFVGQGNSGKARIPCPRNKVGGRKGSIEKRKTAMRMQM
jgi:hypothetical protein